MASPYVLLVDDNEDDLELTLHAFKRAGVTNVVVARDGVEALDYLFGRGEHDAPPKVLPRVSFVDVRMPRLDGIDVVRAVRADPRTARMPLVMLTSSTEPIDVERSYAAGANSYVRKAIDPDEFMSLAEQLRRYWLETNQVGL